MSINVTFVLVVLLAHHVIVGSANLLEGKISQLVETGTTGNEEPRKKHQQQDVFSRILPMLATPFIMQTTLLPMVLMGMKFMLLNSIFIGKIALILWAINLLRSRNDDSAALYSHNINLKHNDYPGHFYDDKHQRYSSHYGRANEGRSRTRRR